MLHDDRDRIRLRIDLRAQPIVRTLRNRVIAQPLVVTKQINRILQVRSSELGSHPAILQRPRGTILSACRGSLCYTLSVSKPRDSAQLRGDLRETALARKARKARKAIERRISDQAFKKEFTQIISDHLSLLPAEEQNSRLEAARGVISKNC